MTKKPTLQPFGIAKEIDNAAISHLGATIAKTHLLAYANSNNVGAEALVTWLHSKIETTDLSNLTSTWGWRDEATQKVSVDTVRRFIMNGKAPHPRVLKIYLAFLVEVGFLDEKSLILSRKWDAQLGSRPASDKVKDLMIESDLRFLVGTHYGEIPTRKGIDVKCFWFAEARADERVFGDLLTSVKKYFGAVADPTLNRQIDAGQSDEQSQMLGRYKYVKGHVRFEYGEETGYSIRNLLRGYVVRRTNRDIRLQFVVGHQGSENYAKIGSPFVSERDDFPNLTIRQKNNIMGKRPRFVAPIKTETIRGLMSNELSQADINLLEAAKSHSALDMMVALHSGADINAVDPANGQTALHYVAQGLDPYSFTVLAYEPEYQEALLDAIEKETDLDRLEVDHAVRRAQKSLNPLILDHENRFASERADPVRPPWEDPDEVTEGPIAEMRELIYNSIHYLESAALEKRGLSKWLNDPDVYSMEDRLAQLGIAEIPPRPSGMD